MARVGVICFVVLAFGFFVMQAMAENSELKSNEVKPHGGGLAAETDSHHSDSVAEEPSSSMEGSQAAEGPAIRKLSNSSKHHKDKSVAGGGVIIGGLVTAIFAAVFCYIRVTRKRGGVY